MLLALTEKHATQTHDRTYEYEKGGRRQTSSPLGFHLLFLRLFLDC